MSEIQQLHWSLRRYCQDRSAEWARRYEELQEAESRERQERGEPEPTSYAYSPEAYATFPRYHIDEAILIAIEAFTPEDFSPLEEARSMLAAAAKTAESIFTTSPSDDIEREAIEDERNRFIRFALT